MPDISSLLKWLVALAAILAGAGLIVVPKLPMKPCRVPNCIASFPRHLFAPCIALFLFLGLGLTAAPPAQAQLSDLYTFTNNGSVDAGVDGASPEAGLIMDSAGNLYGTTNMGGENDSLGYGSVFELVHSSGSYSKKNLFGFTGPNAEGTLFPYGARPTAGLITDSAGNLYGTTADGGANGLGTVFELVYSSGSYSEVVLYSFTGTDGDGALPLAGLIMDPAGNLYGTTEEGGTSTACAGGCGTVFELPYLTPQGVPSYGYERVLYSFTGADGDGALPQGGLIFDSALNLYGTTIVGGTSTACMGGCGTVFELYPSGVQSGELQPNYSESILYSFNGPGGDGADPVGGLIMDSAGNLYGTTEDGGTTGGPCAPGISGNAAGCGTAFELIYYNGTYTERILHNFTGTDGDGAFPFAALIMDSAGDLYGTTPYGGTGDDGTVFELVYPSYLEGVLHSFTGADGANPVAGLIMDPAGNLYGTTEFGGTGNTTNDVCPVLNTGPSCAGTVFKLAKSTNPPSGPDCSGVYSGIHGGPIVVLPSTLCEFSNSEIDGNVEMSGGTLVLSNTVVTGNIQMTGASTFSMSLSTVIQGNLQVQNTSLSTAPDVVCGATINGNLQFLDSATGIDLGSLTVCPGNTIGGSLQVQDNSGPVQILDITVNGNLQVQNNTGSTQINGNTVSGNVQVENNTASTQANGNTVGGNLQIENNTVSTQVFSNAVKGNLQCENNASITGEGNTASQKQGQCSDF